MENKKIKIMTLIGMIVSVFASIFFIVEGGNNQSQASMNNEVAYESEIFGTEIISIEIIADDDDWEEMLENAVSEEYIMADVVVNGTTDGQTSNPEALVNAGNLNISTLGSMGGGNRGGEDAGNERGPQQGQTEGVLSEKDPEVMMRAMDLIFEADGEPTDEILEELLSLGFTEEQIEELTTVAEENVNKEAPGNAGNTSQENVQEKNQMVPGVGTDSSENISINDSKGYMEIGIFSVGILGALFFAKNYKRNY